ncbi:MULTISPECIES: TonB-dependent receptor [Lysobacter]|uniref:TonB-dependent receptor n=1 Tax=Lysobacter TaxID=68 RepID=UPI001F3DFE44|nr:MULTISPECIES: TonB-dependent receptor [Lysobacter]UJB20554.1 TonB-dependent receptor [Lysobacter capsici]UJQ30332.1 TonB-dependent receptor [Lysobacter gummosus]
MKQMRVAPRHTLLTSALLLALAQPVYAQNTTPAPDTAAEPQRRTGAADEARTLDTVVVTGIKGSLTSSMNLKRDAQGVVDGIAAEDIGKFPDTNLAEALQRISGVSIDRSNGEGSRVTVRGVGPDFNLVLLNGRQMPTATGGRAFEFSDLAAESISAVEVYKTSRAATPTGGIGATINIKTARPLDNPGMHANAGIKGIWDGSDDDLPGGLRGSSVTPDASGIFSNTFGDGRFGVSLSANYQKRESGSASAFVASGNGWRPFIDTPLASGEGSGSALPLPGQPGSENITNRPGPNDVYSMPQSLGYSVNSVKRERINSQLTFQWAPTDDLTATLDYTYSQNKIEQMRNDMSVWLNFTPGVSSWTPGSGSSPLTYDERYAGNSDFANGTGKSAVKRENKSVGLNVEWNVTDKFSLNLDYHRSTADSLPDSPYGSSNTLASAGFLRAGNTIDFSRDFPVLTLHLPAGMNAIDPAQMLVTGSVFRNDRQRAEIEQFQASGEYQFQDYSKLNFGVATTDYENRSAFTNVQLDTWGGATSVNDYPDSVWQLQHMGDYFNGVSGSRDPRFTDSFFMFDFDTVRQLAEDAWVKSGKGVRDDYRASFDYSGAQVPGSAANRSVGDSQVREKSSSFYVQWSNTFDWKLPVNVAAGVRYERTKVKAQALQPAPAGIDWVSENEFIIRYSGSEFRKLDGDYKYWLPSLDVSVDLTENMKLRASYGESIGRPNWSSLNPALGVGGQARFDGGGGGAGNPALKPLESRNFDLSYEWYYGESSYLSVGYFRKNIDNFIADQVSRQTPYPDLHTPASGAYWNAAIGAGGCAATDRACIRNYILNTFNGQPGVVRTGTNANGSPTGTISGLPGDPVLTFNITEPVNNRADTLDGWEFNIQHVFGESGFGLAANYTIVNSGLTYDNGRLGTQFAMTGLSDSANVVAFYEKGPWQARAAYNWRDEFLTSLGDGKGANPIYVEAYGQLDMNVSYAVTENLVLSLEGINVTDETMRTRGRNKRQLYSYDQSGPRYMFGVRYKF